MEEENQDPQDYKRYFIIQFTGLTADKQQQKGKVHMFTSGGCFVNEEFIHKIIKRDFDLTEPYISGIIEMDEEDFIDFTSPANEYNQTEIAREANEVKKIDLPKQQKSDIEDYL